MQGIHYREHRPPPDLADRVECIWTSRSLGPLTAATPNRVLPDGCVDVILNLGDAPLPGRSTHPRPRSYVVGAMLRPVTVRLAGAVDLVGIRFRPGGAAAFLPFPLAEATDRVVALPDAWGAFAGELESRAFEAHGRERVQVLEDALRRRTRAGAAVHPAVARASALIAGSHGAVTVRRLAEASGVSGRHLERLFAEQVGLTPKAASRVARFRRLCGAIRAHTEGPESAWTSLALECGYHDQAHMIRDFREFAGLTPEAYRRERAGVASVQYAAPAAT